MIIEHPKSDLPAKLRGLHLFHFGAAPCAQRVRFVLAEKGIRRGPDVPWRSDAPAHLEAPDDRTYVARSVSLPLHQNLTAEYAAIQPNMVVPALVHDGVLHIESVDIMDYVNEQLPGPMLVPHGPAGEDCRALIARAQDLHVSIRYVTYNWSLGRVVKLGRKEQERIRQIEGPSSPDQLAKFYGDFSSGAIAESVFVEHLRALETGFGSLDARLMRDGRNWLTGPTFSMADIIWSLKVQRVSETCYPFERNFPRLWAWFQRVVARPTFMEAIWRDTWLFSRAFKAKATVENFFGRGIRRFASAPEDLRRTA